MKRSIILKSKYNLATDNMNSKDEYFIRDNQAISDIPKDVQNLFLIGYGNSLEKVEFPKSLTNLKSITIGEHCFQNARKLLIDDLPKLERVIIGMKSFQRNHEEEEGEGEEKLDDGICQITNCPNLRQLEIGNHSFKDFKSFELFNVNSLQSIKFDWNCFKYADFLLKGE